MFVTITWGKNFLHLKNILKKLKIPKFDNNLIIEINLLSNGADNHLIVNRIAAYKGSYHLLVEHPDEIHLDLFNEAERELKIHINKLRQEKYHNKILGYEF